MKRGSISWQHTRCLPAEHQALLLPWLLPSPGASSSRQRGGVPRMPPRGSRIAYQRPSPGGRTRRAGRIRWQVPQAGVWNGAGAGGRAPALSTSCRSGAGRLNTWRKHGRVSCQRRERHATDGRDGTWNGTELARRRGVPSSAQWRSARAGGSDACPAHYSLSESGRILLKNGQAANM